MQVFLQELARRGPFQLVHDPLDLAAVARHDEMNVFRQDGARQHRDSALARRGGEAAANRPGLHSGQMDRGMLQGLLGGPARGPIVRLL